jgi:hypothetical protein
VIAGVVGSELDGGLGADVPVVLVSRAPESVAQDVDGETVVFVPGGGQMLLLDPVATRVWAALEHPMQLADLCERLAEEFGVPVAQVAHDLTGPYEVLVTGGAIVATVLAASSALAEPPESPEA